MSPSVVLLVLTAGLLHALTHVVIKLGHDKFLVYAVVNAVGLLVAAPLWIVSAPMDHVPVLAVAASVAFHQLYKVFVICSYSSTDLGRAFPIARGSAPLLVFVGSVLLLRERMSEWQMAGAVLILASLALLVFKDEGLLSAERRGVLFALLTGLTTAAYTLIDGHVVREGGSAFRYVALLYTCDGLFFPAAALAFRRRQVADFLRQHYAKSFLAGLMAISSYGIVVLAMQHSQIGLVAVLREISIVFAALIGALAMREPFGPRRTLASLLVFFGVLGVTR